MKFLRMAACEWYKLLHRSPFICGCPIRKKMVRRETQEQRKKIAVAAFGLINHSFTGERLHFYLPCTPVSARFSYFVFGFLDTTINANTIFPAK